MTVAAATVTVEAQAEMRKVLFAAVIVAAALLAVTFALKNPQSVTIAWYGQVSFTQPLAVVLCLTLLLGVLLGYGTAVLRNYKLQRKLRRAKKREPETVVAASPALPSQTRDGREALSRD